MFTEAPVPLKISMYFSLPESASMYSEMNNSSALPPPNVSVVATSSR